MNTHRWTLLIFATALNIFLLSPASARADDAPALYKAKCAVCHAADGAGKPAMKIPSLISPEAKKLSDAELTDAIADGGKAQKPNHAFAKKGISPEQVKALVAHIRTLQK